MKNSLFLSALLVCGATLFYSQHSSGAQQGITAPWKNVSGRVVYQPAVNIAPVTLPGASAADFFVIYTNRDGTNIARSQGQFYCNDQILPEGFEPGSARAIDSFMFSNVGSFIRCKKTVIALDIEHFRALDFPYYTDGKVVMTISGNVLKEADAATFTVLAQNQARDKKQYYFNAGTEVVLPYKQTANAFPPCYGWANVDGSLYYEGMKYPEGDAASFRCFSFSNAADKRHFYSGGKVAAKLPKGVEVNRLRAVDEDVYSDGNSVWFVNVSSMLLEGLDAAQTKVGRVSGDTHIIDGKTTWLCPSMGIAGKPRCTKAAPH